MKYYLLKFRVRDSDVNYEQNIQVLNHEDYILVAWHVLELNYPDYLAGSVTFHEMTFEEHSQYQEAKVSRDPNLKAVWLFPDQIELLRSLVRKQCQRPKADLKTLNDLLDVLRKSFSS